jgi:hypothetical protein
MEEQWLKMVIRRIRPSGLQRHLRETEPRLASAFPRRQGALEQSLRFL